MQPNVCYICLVDLLISTSAQVELYSGVFSITATSLVVSGQYGEPVDRGVVEPRVRVDTPGL